MYQLQGSQPQTCICYIQGMLCYNNKKKLDIGAFSTKDPNRWLLAPPIFVLPSTFSSAPPLFCLSTAKCSWSHTNENEGHERKEMKMDISGLHTWQGLVIFVLSVLFSFICHTFCLVQGQSARFFIKVPIYTNTYLQIDATSLTGSLFSDLDLSYYHTLMLLFLIF